MNRWLGLALISLGVSTPLQAASLSLDAHEIGSKETYRSHWEIWGSYDRSYVRGKQILVTVRDLSRKAASCKISVYFIAQPAPGAKRFIYDLQEFTPEFRGRLEMSAPIQARDLRARVRYLAPFGTIYGKGATIDGWIVVGSSDDGVFGIKASSQTLLEIAQEHERQPQSLGQMIAEYDTAISQRSQRSRN